jgi:hypothetical protein
MIDIINKEIVEEMDKVSFNLVIIMEVVIVLSVLLMIPI